MITRILLILSLVFLSASLSGQSKSIRKFYRKYKRTEDTVNINAPGWLIRIGLWIAGNELKDDPNDRAIFHLATKIRKARILVMEDKRHLLKGDLDHFLQQAGEEGFENVVKTKEDDAETNVLIVLDDDVIRKMIVLSEEADSFSMIALRTKIHKEDLEYVLQNAGLK